MRHWALRRRFGFGAGRVVLAVAPHHPDPRAYPLRRGLLQLAREIGPGGAARALVPVLRTAGLVAAAVLLFLSLPTRTVVEPAPSEIRLVPFEAIPTPVARVLPEPVRPRTPPPPRARPAPRRAAPRIDALPVPPRAVSLPRAVPALSHAPRRARASRPRVTIDAAARPAAPALPAAPTAPFRPVAVAGVGRPALPRPLALPTAPPGLQVPDLAPAAATGLPIAGAPPVAAPPPPLPGPPGAGAGMPGETLRGEPLESLASCASDAEEDSLKRRVIATVQVQMECKSDAGTYRFLETKNLNAFLMWVHRRPDRAALDRCGELQLALECLGTSREESSAW